MLKITFGFFFFLHLCLCQSSPTSITDGTLPPGVSPGSVLGSYPLSNIDSVNLFSGAVNASIPLHTIQGRGSVSFPIVTNLENRWNLYAVSGSLNTYIYPMLESGFIGINAHLEMKEGYEYCPDSTNFIATITRFQWHDFDGNISELVSMVNDGKPFLNPNACHPSPMPPQERQRIFISKDGLGLTYISDSSIWEGDGIGPIPCVCGYLYKKDGTTYRIENRKIVWIRDKDGNLTSLMTDGSGRYIKIIDSLGRETNIHYQSNEVWIDVQGTVLRRTKVKLFRLEDLIRSDLDGIKKVNELFPSAGIGGVNNQLNNPLLIGEIEIPNGQKYFFKYNNYGEVSWIELPTGGHIYYDWAGRTNEPGGTYGTLMIYRRLIKRRVYNNLGQIVSLTDYDAPVLGVGGNDLEVIEYQKDANSNTLRSMKHKFHGSPLDSAAISSISFSKWNEGKEFQKETRDSNQFIKEVESYVWNQRDGITNQSYLPPEPISNHDDRYRKNDPRLVETSTLRDSLSSKRTYDYTIDAHNNIKKQCDYDYGASTPTRCVEYNYEINSSYVNEPVHLRGLVRSEKIYKNTVLESQTDTTYDEYGSSNIKLIDRVNISEHDPNRRKTYTTRGNPTTVSVWLNQPAEGESSSKTFYEYDIAGNVVKIQYPKVKSISGLITPETTIGYTDDYDTTPGSGPTFAFPTQVNQPEGITIKAKYYYGLGRIREHVDPNGRITNYYYGESDALDRLTRVTHPGNGSTSFQYLPNEIMTIRTQGSGLSDIVTKNVFDGLGRNSQSIRLNACGTGQNAITEMRYDALGRVSQVSNPECGNPSLWTQTTYDELDRPLNVTYPDQSVKRTRYSGNETIIRDPANKWTKIVMDALGRIQSVIEDPTASIDGTFTNSSPQNLLSAYTYDARGNILMVTQGNQTRSFTYDSASRLKTASSPEWGLSQDGGAGSDQNGIMTYGYDPAGNITSRTIARTSSTNAVVNYSYDARGRLRTKSYSGAVSTTPAVYYCYDGATSGTDCSTAPTDSDPVNNPKNLKGRLTMVKNSDATSIFDAYDGLGRVISSKRNISGYSTPFAFTYGYNHVELNSVVYPSGRRVDYGFDAAGQIQTVTGNPGSSQQRNYVMSAKYTPHGAITQLTLANQRYELNCFNSRLQISGIQLKTQAPTIADCNSTTNNLAKLNFEFDVANNGNLKSQTVSDGVGFSAQQSYTYDKLNRIKTASEPGGTGWQLTYDYDRWGNQWLDTVTNINLYSNTPRTSSWFSGKNRIRLGVGGYDLAGNQLKFDPYTLSYDGENLVREVTSALNGSASYRYDGEGRRVKKIAGGVTTYFVYDASGQLAAEYEQGSSSQAMPCATCYLLTDHLGSTRVIYDESGVKARYDYLPFGEYIPKSRSGRSTASCAGGVTNCYPGTGIETNSKVAQMFTGKERDAETGLDYFGARYFSGAQGRFTSPDPFNPVDELVGQEFDDYLANPQYWNKYAYSLNNPLKYKDSDGNLPHAVVGGLVGGGIGGALELYSQMRSGQDINWAKVGTKAGVGAAVGATAAATFGTSLLIQGGSLALVNAGAGIADRALDNDASTQALDQTAIVTDTVVGGVAGVVGGVVGKQVQTAVQNSAGQKLNERLADHAVRATAGRSASRQAGAREAQRQAAEHPAAMGRRAAGPGRAAAKAGTTAAAQRATELLKKRKEEEEQR